jgi:tetratricopeptide (TPR) repeat protein
MVRRLAQVLFVLGLLGGGFATADDPFGDGRFLAGLRRRQLFELAETYCTVRLDDARISDAQKAELVIELSLSLTDWAVNSPPDRREQLWQRARQTTDNFIATSADNPRLLLVCYQAASGLLLRGELARQEAQVVSDGGPLFEEARTNLRLAIARFEELDKRIRGEIRERNLPGPRDPARSNPDILTDYQLVSIQRDVQYQLARALRNQGQCYQPGSPDRANSLTQAVEKLNSAAGSKPADRTTLEGRIDGIVCHRLLEEYATARRMLDALLEAGTPPAIQLRAKAEEIRLTLAANALPQAVAMLSQPRELDGVTSADLDYARLEVCLAAWRSADQSKNLQEAARWQTEATAMVGAIERLHGPYWTRRAELLLAGYVESSSGGGDLVMRVRAAESSYRSGRIDDAVAAYDRARQLATQIGDTAQAFDLGFTAAAIIREAGRHQEALSRFRRLAMSMPSAPKAPQSHRAAIYHAGQLALDGTQASLQTYVDLLDEHIKTWPTGSEVDQVRWQLGNLRKHQADWQDAVAAYRAISTDFIEYDQVVEAATDCYLAWLDDLKRKGLPTDEIAAAAAGWLESLVFTSDGRPPERWSRLARKVILWAAQIRMDYTTNGYGRAEQLLWAAMNSADKAPPDWLASAQTLLVFSLAGQERRPEAAAVLDQISQGPTDKLLKILEGITRLSADAGGNVRLELAGLQLRTVELLRPRREELTQSQLHHLDRVTAEALVNIGRVDEALQAYAQLARTLPNDGDVQEGYARLLGAQPDRASLETALDKWRELAKRTPQGTDRWFRAKYAIARLHLRMNDKPKAENIIRLLEVLHPELGGPRMKTRFDQLRAECRR